MKKILLTGGGSAGHVTPNLSLISHFNDKGYSCVYIGSYSGIERQMTKGKVKYHPIFSGKWRRYFSLKNLIDPFFIVLGFFQSLLIILKEKPNIVFSKGGFIAPPVVIAAWVLRKEIFIHESDYSPGIATKITAPFAKIIFVSDNLAQKNLQQKYNNVELVDLPISQDLLNGDKKNIKFKNTKKPTLLIMGGSLGASSLNAFLKENFTTLKKQWNIIHLTGQKEYPDMPDKSPSYIKHSFVQKELPDIYAKADLILARAGATSLKEFKALKKKCILVPLPQSQSRGEQLQNAQDMSEKYPAEVILDENLNLESFNKAAQNLKSKSFPKVKKTQSILDFI